MHFTTNHSLFGEVGRSCSNELKKHGVEAEVWVTPGGVGLRILSPAMLNMDFLSRFPIREIDFKLSRLDDVHALANLPLRAIGLPENFPLNFKSLSIFPLESLLAEGVQADDFIELSTSGIEKLSLGRTCLKDLKFCQSLPLKLLQLDHCSIHDLKPIEGKEIFHLNLFKCEVSDLSPLSGMPLVYLDICANKISDLSPLVESSLKKLEMRATRVEDLRPLSGLPLEYLSLPGSPVRILSHLVSCPIEDLNIIGLSIDDLACIKQLPLKRLSVSPDKLTSRDLELIKSLDLGALIGPGDDNDQNPQQFFDKYKFY